MSVQFGENGNCNLKELQTLVPDLDMELYITDDNCVFARVVHHNNNSGTTLFTKDNVTDIQTEDLYSRLYLMEQFRNTDGGFEFLVLQEDDTNIYRWKQSSNPTTTTACTDYVNISNTSAGLMLCSGNTFMAHSSSSGNWWCAVGAYTKYNTGIPGFGGKTVTGYLDFYVRIDNLPDRNKMSIYENYVVCNDVYEL
jgi:hypothetical protein